MLDSIKGSVAIVTGGGGEIGRAGCLALSKAGAKIVVVDLSHQSGNETACMVQKNGGEALFFPTDVTKKTDVQNYVDKTLDAFGRIDLFFNNAGWEGIVKPIVEYPEDVFDKVISINIKGVFLALKYVLPVMINQGGGNIINMSSTVGVRGTPNIVGYTASKHAVLGITKVASAEVAKFGIRVNAICPGPVRSRMIKSLHEGFAHLPSNKTKKRKMKDIPDGRLAEPEEVANLMLYLFSNSSSHITGQSFVIDGGAIQHG